MGVATLVLAVAGPLVAFLWLHFGRKMRPPNEYLIIGSIMVLCSLPAILLGGDKGSLLGMVVFAAGVLLYLGGVAGKLGESHGALLRERIKEVVREELRERQSGQHD